MRVLVTGGCGFIGTALCQRLLNHGHEVVAIDNLTIPTNPLKPHWWERYTFIRANVHAGLARTTGKFDAVIHLAARLEGSVEHPTADFYNNVLSTQDLLEWVRQAQPQAHVIFASSCSVYGNQPGRILHEDDDKQPNYPYAANKLAAEAVVLGYHNCFKIKTTRLRLSNVYGPGYISHSGAGVIPHFVDAKSRNKHLVIYGDGGDVRDYTYIEDVCDAFMAILKKERKGLFNVSTGIGTTTDELAETTESYYANDKFRLYAEPRSIDVVRFRVLSNDRLRCATGWEPKVDVHEGIRRTVEWKAAGAVTGRVANPKPTDKVA